MAQRIFWDAWAFVALADKSYRYYPEALQMSLVLERQKAIMVTTEAVLTEVGNHYSKHHLRHLALGQYQFAARQMQSGRGTILNISTGVWERTWQFYQSRPDKDWGHTDCISFVVMQELGLTTAFTADVHFEQAGFVRLVKI